jgi:hypothetical protein
VSDPDPDRHDADWDDFGDDPPDRCHTCHGDGWVIIGLDLDCDDGVNGPFDGEAVKCPNCGGSGLAKDCTCW